MSDAFFELKHRLRDEVDIEWWSLDLTEREVMLANAWHYLEEECLVVHPTVLGRYAAAKFKGKVA